MRSLSVGQVLSWEKTFTLEDVEAFIRLSADERVHPLQPDADGRRLVHCLLLAMLPTTIGGSMNLVARDMSFTFLCPVFTGDRIRCDVEIAETEPTEGQLRLAFAVVCRNQHGEEVMTGTCSGVLRTA